MNYIFTQDWFSNNIEIWTPLLKERQPKKILEIGSFEGRSATFFIENLADFFPISLFCIDTWGGSEEHKSLVLEGIEKRFDYNILVAKSLVNYRVDFYKLKGQSSTMLEVLKNTGHKNSFDFIYIDGSHKTEDVKLDSLFSYSLIRDRGIIVFDDYLWRDPNNIKCDDVPMPAIDFFLDKYKEEVNILHKGWQLIVEVDKEKRR